VRDDQGNVVKIVEYKDCDENQCLIKEINTGIYCVDNALLFKHLGDISNENAQKEYYITDLIEIFHHNGYDIQGLPVQDVNEVMGINDRIDLAKASAWLQNHINMEWMRQGVTLLIRHRPMWMRM
jgi:bifunctional UDP-N-acetylglucosamine pyrophosphorylase / glucosamine-1-phosphate N-acetyltransferase